MIELYTGAPGSGKTYALTHRVRNALKKGYTIYANYDIDDINAKVNGRLHRWHRLEEIYNVRNGIIVMDEAHVYMNSRRWETMPDEMQVRLQQHRKDGLHIWGSAQSHKRLDVVYRELVQKWYSCRKLISWGRYDDPELKKKGKKPKSRFGRFGYILVTEQNPEEMEARMQSKVSIMERISNTTILPILAKVVDAYSTEEKIENNAEPMREVMHVDVVCRKCGPLKPTHVH